MHETLDPNTTPFDPKCQGICIACAVKLWDLGKGRLTFKMRGETVRVTTDAAAPRSVTLSTGYEVDLAETDGLEHLFNAVFHEVLSRLKDTPEFEERGLSVIYDVCLYELHFIAGQLHAVRSSITIQFLLDEFGVQWDRIADEFNGG